MTKRHKKKGKEVIKNKSGATTAVLPPGQRNVAHGEIRAETFSGPLPHPQILQQYEDIVSGAAERILAMAESQTQHRQLLETKAITSDIIDGRIGLVFGFIVALAAVVAGAYCISQGHPVCGTILGAGSITGLVSVFVYGSRQRRKEREEKYRIAHRVQKK